MLPAIKTPTRDMVRDKGSRQWRYIDSLDLPWIKRLFDLAFSIPFFILFSPLMLLIAIAIKLDSSGKVFFRQVRFGKRGKSFRLLKFRTMKVNNDANKHEEFMKDLISGKAKYQESQEEHRIIDDPRITRVGSFLRKTNLDELPQLINVIRGQMSLVGPRPPVQYELEFYRRNHRERLEVTPGITGLWQVSDRFSYDFNGMVQLDVRYIQNWSLLMDLKILVRTLMIIFGYKRRGGKYLISGRKEDRIIPILKSPLSRARKAIDEWRSSD